MSDLLLLEDVLKRSGVPTVTFVEPLEYEKLLVGFRTPGRAATRYWRFGALLAAVVVLGACSGSEHSTDGYRGGTFQRTVQVWTDGEGAFTCPPEGPIATSNPPQCAAKTGDRVRLTGEAIDTYVAESGRSGTESERGTWIGTAKITGRSVDGGFTIETETADGE
jgi:hypothetical protein